MKRSASFSPRIAACLPLLSLSPLLIAAGALLATSTRAAAASVTETVLHSFTGIPQRPGDGAYPGPANLIPTGNGSFYGVTTGGGYYSPTTGIGYGTIYTISPSGAYNILYLFGTNSAIANDGVSPSSLLIGPDGNLYGTTQGGGKSNVGTAFKLTPLGLETQLHSFKTGDGKYPFGLALGSDGNLYGAADADQIGENAVLYGLKTTGGDFNEQLFFTPSDADNYGQQPSLALAAAPGSPVTFYGATEQGGADGEGTIFAFTPGFINQPNGGRLNVLHDFNYLDGTSPINGTLQLDSAGNLYGTASAGGGTESGGPQDGTIFRLAPDGTYKILHTFSDSDGSYPEGGLTLASDGNYYGTCYGGGAHGNGILFRIAPDGSNFAVVYNFGGSSLNDAGVPETAPVEDSDGDLIGQTEAGGIYNLGAVYKVALGLKESSSIASLTLTPSSLTGGSEAVKAIVTLSAPAPGSGATVTLGSSDPANAAVKATLTIPAGSSTGSAIVRTKTVAAPEVVTISALYNSSKATANLTVTPQPPLATLQTITFDSATVIGELKASGRAYLNGNASTATTVSFTSSNTAVATAEPSVVIQSGTSSHEFVIETKSVKKPTTVTITASSGGISTSANLTVNP